MTPSNPTAGAFAVWRNAALGYAPDFSGRATRRELLAVVVFSAMAAIAFATVDVTLARNAVDAMPRDSAALPSVVGVLHGVVGGLLAGLPVLAATVRRLHDANRTAAALTVVVFPYVGIFILGYLLLAEGHPFENQFGPDPRG